MLSDLIGSMNADDLRKLLFWLWVRNMRVTRANIKAYLKKS